MKKIITVILFSLFTLLLTANNLDLSSPIGSCDQQAAADTMPALVTDSDYSVGSSPFSPLEHRRLFLKHIRDSIDAVPFDTTRDDDYWRRSVVNGKWGFFTDPTVKLPGFLKLASKIYKFYSKAFNNYDTAYVASIKKDWKLMVINNDWLDSYSGVIDEKTFKIFMNSNISASVGAHISYMGIGYTYMFDLDNLFGGDPTGHTKWEMSFATSRFSFEAYRSRNTGAVNIHRFGDYNKGHYINKRFEGLSRVSSGCDLYYFFNHRKYSQAAAYSFSKVQKRSAGTFIAGFLYTKQDVDIDFSLLDEDMKAYLPYPEYLQSYRYHYRVYSILGGYAYNWVFRPNWLFNVTLAPSIGLNHSYWDSSDGVRDMLSFDYRVKLGLVRIAGNFFYGLRFFLDGHLYLSHEHRFLNMQEDITISAGFRF